MLALLATYLLAIGGIWSLQANSGALMMLANVAAASTGAYLLIARIARDPTLSRGLAFSLQLLGLALGWYVFRVVLSTFDYAVEDQGRELMGGVLPGLLFGAVTASAIAARTGPDRAALETDRHATRLMLRVNALTLCGIVAYLIANLRIDILLVASDQLEGAETYQELGDALTFNMFTAYLLARVDARQSPQPKQWIDRLLGLPVIVFATLLCGGLVGSNKLLLISLIVAATIALPAIWRWISDYPARGLLTVVLVLGSLVAALYLSGTVEVIGELLGRTRLFDYGNAASILEIPSIESRSQVIADCAARQFAHAPFFGDIAVEYYSCGEGHYVHSILSVQTHLGMVGSALFLAVLMRGAWVLTTCRDYRPVWTVFAVVLFVGVIAAFFTWTVFWYLLGLISCLPPRQTMSRVSSHDAAGATYAA